MTTDLLLTFYGDDFTGSTDSMEVLALAGIRTVLFLDVPARERLSRYEGLQAYGIAGHSRTLTPEAMDAHLSPIFAHLAASGAPIVHYKICSTFDSSPRVGSIGRAIDLGRRFFPSGFVPLLSAAPTLGRHCVFGNLFARSGLDSVPYRLDRHPTMSRHPVTPMDESDLRLHLSKQTSKSIALFDVLDLVAEDRDARFRELLASEPEIVLFDALYDEHMPVVGELLTRDATPSEPVFTVGSSGIEYALAAHWERTGMTPSAPNPAVLRPVDRVFIVSGSCSPVTARQIDYAVSEGFAVVAIRTPTLADEADREREIERVVDETVRRLRSGHSVIAHVCSGPDDPRLRATREAFARSRAQETRDHAEEGVVNETIGRVLGRILLEVSAREPLRRLGVTGGDTSGVVAQTLSIEALETAAAVHPGSPLCRIHTPDGRMDGVEILFKGGQVGRTDLFETLLQGIPHRIPA